MGRPLERLVVAVDSEGWPHLPYSIQFSLKPGTGYMIKATDRVGLRAFEKFLHDEKPIVVVHSLLHELAMFRALGIDTTGVEFADTMVMAYLLQLVPRGLKPSCIRMCDMKMREYHDVVGDIENEQVRDYLTWIWDGEQTEWLERRQAELERINATPLLDAEGNPKRNKAGEIRYHKCSKPPSLPKTPLHKACERVMQSKTPRKLFEDQNIDIQVAAYRRLGPVPLPTLDFVAPEEAIPYGCRDADGTLRLLPAYGERVERMGLRECYTLELATYPLIDRMQRVGIRPDLETMAEVSELLAKDIDRLQAQLESETSRPGFNANSGDQVADFLFGELGIEEVKFTSGGRGSTNDKILEALEHEHPEHPSITTIRTFREVYKLKHTFVDRIPDYVNRWPHDGRVHATFRTTSVVTGRLAAADPNILAMPEHSWWANYFKLGWIADPGHVLGAWDQSQIELRGLAHLSQDPTMCAVFRGDLRNPDGTLIDLHAATAERVFGVKPKDQDKHKHRLPAKAINFGIPMGMTCRGLSVELRKNGVDADEDTAQRWLDDTLALYGGVRAYMDNRIAEARERGYIRCLSGRVRYIGGIRSKDDRVREEAERFAFSTPIQESAQWIMKQAEANVWNDVLPTFWKRGVYCEPLYQQHDALKMEVDEKHVNELNVAMRQAMINVPKSFSVPLDVDGEWGWNMAPVERSEKEDAGWYNPQGMRKFK